MILIEAFPVNIISDMPADKAKIPTPSDKGGEEPFAGVFAVLTSESSSSQPESWDRKEAYGFEKSDRDSAQLLSDHSPAENLVGVSTTQISHPEAGSQQQDISGCSLKGLGQNSLYAQEAGLSLVKNSNVLSQPGLTQEGVYGFTSVKDPGKAKELLLKLGLNSSEVEQLVGMKSNGPSSKKEATLIFQLMNALQQEGVSPDQVKLTINDAKSLLAKIGINIEDTGLIVTGRHSGEEVSLKELINLLNSKANINIYDGDTVRLSENKKLFTQTGNEANHSKGNPDLGNNGQFTINAIADREVEGENRPVEFERMIFKTEMREPTAQRVIEQIVKGAHAQVRSGQTRVKISLRPPSLGELQLSIVTREDQVKVAFFAETPQVKEIIENNLPQLRESFFQQGLKVENFSVFVGNHPSGSQAEQQNDFNAIRTSQSMGKGQDGDDTPPLEGLKRLVFGNHRVDLFV